MLTVDGGYLLDMRRVVVITGAGGALGTAISRQLAGEPDTELVLSDISEARSRHRGGLPATVCVDTCSPT